MKLKKYIESKGITQREFALRLGVHYIYIYKICAGLRRPSPEMATKIEQVTDGQVLEMESLYPERYK